MITVGTGHRTECGQSGQQPVLSVVMLSDCVMCRLCVSTDTEYLLWPGSGRDLDNNRQLTGWVVVGVV